MFVSHLINARWSFHSTVSTNITILLYSNGQTPRCCKVSNFLLTLLICNSNLEWPWILILSTDGGGSQDPWHGGLSIEEYCIFNYVQQVNISFWDIRLWLRLRFWFRLSLRIFGLGEVEVVREDQAAEVDTEPPAPDRDPLEVPDLHVCGHLEADLLTVEPTEDGGAVVSVSVDVSSDGKDVSFILVWVRRRTSLSPDPEESVGSWEWYLKVIEEKELD